jgi:hypothetical protein
MKSLIIHNLQLVDLGLCEVILYILVCIPLFILAFLICLMNIENEQNKVCDTDRLAVALRPYIGSRCIDVGFHFRLNPPLSYNNVTLVYIRNYGNNIAWFHYTPGRTRIDQTLIARISSLKMDVPDDFRTTPHLRKTG